MFKYKIFMEILPVELSCSMQTDVRMDTNHEANSHFSQFLGFEKLTNKIILHTI